MATTNQHTAAREDPDLVRRFRATAEQLNVPNPHAWVEANIGRLIVVDIDSATPGVQNIADVHAYAVASYVPTPRPGADEAKILDTQLTKAVESLLSESEESGA